MEQRRKIVIPVSDDAREAGAAKNFDGAATVPAPLFDEEATMGARPVVPLAKSATPARPSRFPLLALVVLLAVGAGVAGGFAIGIYKSRQNTQSESAVAPAAATTTAGAQPPAQTTAQQLPATPATIATEKTEKSPAPATRAMPAENAPAERAARDKSAKRGDDAVLAPVEIREREDRVARAREDDREEEREIRKQQRRERRRRAREAARADTDINSEIERGARELNRIREIFEGPRP